jgi:hypothetical protein
MPNCVIVGFGLVGRGGSGVAWDFAGRPLVFGKLEKKTNHMFETKFVIIGFMSSLVGIACFSLFLMAITGGDNWKYLYILVPLFVVFLALELIYLCRATRLRTHFSQYMRADSGPISAFLALWCCTSCAIAQMGAHVDRRLKAPRVPCLISEATDRQTTNT